MNEIAKLEKEILESKKITKVILNKKFERDFDKWTESLGKNYIEFLRLENIRWKVIEECWKQAELKGLKKGIKIALSKHEKGQALRCPKDKSLLGSAITPKKKEN